jgi:hypothetical protein
MPIILRTWMISMMFVAVSNSDIIAVIHSARIMRFILMLARRGVFMVIQSLAVPASVCKGRGAMMTAHWGIAHTLAYCPIAILYLLAILAPNWPWCKRRQWEPAHFLWCPPPHRWPTLPTSRLFQRGLYRRICASIVPQRGVNLSL